MAQTPQAIRMKRLRARQAGKPLLGVLAVTRENVALIRRRMLGRDDAYGQRVSMAIRDAMMRFAAHHPDADPIPAVEAWADAWRPPEHPIDHMARMPMNPVDK